MTNENRKFELASREGGAPTAVLCGVHAEGRLDGLLFDLTLRQTYRNTSHRVLEVVYTFPLPSQAVLLGFASELNGLRQVGALVAKRSAERQYEQALAKGDAPVMLESLGDGLHTANIGNLKPGEELVLEVRFAQLLAFEQGRLRLAIPTTIAPRYGNAEAAGLQPQQVPRTSVLAEYPLALSVTIAGALADARIECPTHHINRKAADDGVRLDLKPGAWLDRDMVIVVEPREPGQPLVLQAADPVSSSAPTVVMAALQPMLSAKRTRMALKLLVDCSGSMAGDSIASAKAAVHGVLAKLSEPDHVSVTCFGTHVRHLLKPTACSRATLADLKHDVDAIAADLGGTEMAAALKAVFDLRLPTACESADVLLVTDGEIWQAEEVIAAARASGHRVFAIGVGTSPAEGVLRSLAESTGGACEFATPGEALEAAASRMLNRMQQQPWRKARIDWGSEPVWQTTLPANLFGGDMVIAFAGMPAAASAPSIRLLARDAQEAQIEIARGAAKATAPSDTLARIAAARRVATADHPQAQQLAVDYQLLTKYTNCILVHTRAEADKAIDQAELHRVSSMLAAGWGATSTIMPSALAEAYSVSSPWDRRHSQAKAEEVTPAGAGSDMDALELLTRLFDQHREKQPASLKEVVDAVFKYLTSGRGIQGLAANCTSVELRAEARLALDQAVALGLSLDEAWLLLAYWANGRSSDRGGTQFAVIAAVLQIHHAALEATATAACEAMFDQVLCVDDSDDSTLSRTLRLARASIRSMP